MALTNAEHQKRWRERRNALANEALRNNATQYYPHLSQWPLKLGPAPTHDHLVQAFALLAGPRSRPMGSRKALAVAAYLSGHYWHPDDLGRAIDAAMGTPAGAANDPRNVITLRGRGVEPRGFVTLDRHSDDRRQTWSCKLTAKGEAVVAAYCAAQGIEDPIAAARERQARATARADEQDQPSLLAPTKEDVAVPDAATGPTLGPAPSSWSGIVSRDANAAATTYAFRFGKRNVWKIGHAQDLQARLLDVNKHIPHEVLGERWSITWQQRWRNQKEAYEMEQRLFTLLAARRTEGERVQCTEDELRAAWVGAASPGGGPNSQGRSESRRADPLVCSE